MSGPHPVTFGEVLEKGALRHGHVCPSLAYGCRLGLLLLAEAGPVGVLSPVIVRHSSSCLLDGVKAALEGVLGEEDIISHRETGSCSVEAFTGGERIVVTIRPEIRARVDALKEDRDLPSFRADGVSLLAGLSDDLAVVVERRPVR
jgi:formylmethanofuran dehydrogenase subunit E